MIEEGDRVLLSGSARKYFVRAGTGELSTDLGVLDLGRLIGATPGTTVATHKGTEFIILVPRPIDFFERAKRTGAPMLPKDIGQVIGYTGMNRRDVVLDAGAGSGITAIYFGGVAASVTTYEIRPDFARIAESNIKDAGLSNVEVIAGDVLEAVGEFDIVNLDMLIEHSHIIHAHAVLRPGGYLACYTPFIEHMSRVLDAATGVFSEVHAMECIEREMTRSQRGTRPSTRVCHSGYITIARK
jgi:tRNA (adenine57-N1/adenine58-N1)-methyltransferase